MTRIVVTGMGIISAAGRGLDATREALRAGRSGLGPLTRFPSPRCGALPVAEVRGVPDEPGVPRIVSLGRIALADALLAAGIGPGDRDGTALAVGTCVGGMPETEAALDGREAGRPVDGSVWLHHECGFATHALALDAGLGGPALTVSTACSSGAQALASGAELLLAGEADAVVAGGVDAICRLTLNGFASLLAVDPEGCRPFDRRRRGMSLGEGAAFLVLETLERARRRGVRPLAIFAGGGNTCDAHHATAPEPTGRGAEAAMRLALERAGRAPADVGYVNAHGTGTQENDRAEGLALARLFGDHAPPVSSTKRVFGHTLGAAGAIEAVVTVLALTDGFLPGTAGLEEPDPACAIRPLIDGRPGSPEVALSSSFGFGGNNTVLCFARAEGLP